jgi:hypothetical protein
MPTVLLVIVCVAAMLVAVELAFRFLYRRAHGRDYFVALKFRWDENHVVAHPFLTFAYRRNGVIERNQRLPYALAPGRYFSFRQPLKLNSIGHFGPDLTLERTSDTLRIACLGSSSLANTIADEQHAFCWPTMLEELLGNTPHLRARYNKVEVMNCGIGGWTMLDVFIDFALNVVNFRPDYVVIYQGLNDLPLHLMDGYSFDYAHGRRNLGEALHTIKRGYWFPKIAWWQSYEYAKGILVGTGNVRNEVLAKVELGTPDYTREYRPLVAEENALRQIILLCKAYGIGVVVSSYVFFDHNGTELNRKLSEGVQLENRMFRKVAEEHDCKFIDIAATFPMHPENFVDAVHFAPRGMTTMAECIAEALVGEIGLKRQKSAVS